MHRTVREPGPDPGNGAGPADGPVQPGILLPLRGAVRRIPPGGGHGRADSGHQPFPADQRAARQGLRGRRAAADRRGAAGRGEGERGNRLPPGGGHIPGLLPAPGGLRSLRGGNRRRGERRPEGPGPYPGGRLLPGGQKAGDGTALRPGQERGGHDPEQLLDFRGGIRRRAAQERNGRGAAAGRLPRGTGAEAVHGVFPAEVRHPTGKAGALRRGGAGPVETSDGRHGQPGGVCAAV